jgi:murein DD-endopeptidase MepM/ murein hydrolase activator NlpD
MIAKPALLLLALAAASVTGATRNSCSDEWLCIEARDSGDAVVLRAVNLQQYPLTFSLRVRARDWSVSGRRVVTATLQAKESRPIMRLTPKNPDNRGRYRYYYDWTVGDTSAEHDDDTLYLMPYEQGRSYRVLQGYGSRFSHTGDEQYAVDFKMQEGTPVHAARGGVVARIEESNSIGCWESGCGNYANFIVILHDDGTTGEYYHLKQYGALVDAGQRVRGGQKIGLSGNTGHTALPHLHFAVYRAESWGRTQSIPVRFLSADGIVSRPRRGGRYPAVVPDDDARQRLTATGSAD